METFTIAENKLFQVEGHKFLFLVADSAIFEIDSHLKGTLNQWGRGKEFTREEFFTGLNNANEEKESLFAGLLQRHVILPARKRTGRPGKGGTGHVPIPLKTLVLHLTEACNLGCVYCYHSQKRVTRKKKGWMTPEVAERAVDFLFDYSVNLKEITLVFFGGEPLLHFDLLSSVVRYAREKAAEKGKKIGFALTTNGTLLTREVIHFLHENRIGVTISIDGSEEIHNRYRCFPDGSPSYNVIVTKVRDLLQGDQHKPVVARVTVTKNFNNVSQMLKRLLGFGFAEVGFAPVTAEDLSYQLDHDEMNHLLDQFEELAGKFLDCARKGEFLGFSNLIDLLVALHQGEIKNYACGAGLGLFSVDHEGRLYLCQRFTGEKSFCMGDVFKGFDRIRLGSFRQQAEIQQRGDCGHCWVRNMCAGGCYHEAWIREGSLVKPNLHYCEWIKKWIGIGLNLYGQVALTCPDYPEKLSMLRGYTFTPFNQFI